MSQGRVVRLFHARPLRVAFDAELRETIVPAVQGSAGNAGVWVGRRGPGELGDRTIVSFWDSAEAMVAALGLDLDRSPWQRLLAENVTDAHVEVLPLLVAVRDPEAPRPTILRIARGRLSRIDLATYAQDVEAGTRRDLARGRGPSTLLLCEGGPDAFVTVSVWSDWDAIATATGASLDQPVRTREQHQIEGFHAVHMELVPPGG